MKRWRNTQSGEFRDAETTPGEYWVEITAPEALNFRLADLEANEKRFKEEIKRLEDEMARRTGPASAAESGEREISFQKLTRGIAHGDWTDADFEKSVIERTAQTTQSDTLGGFIVPPEYLPQEFVEMIYTEINFMNAGARRLNITGGHPITIPTQEGSSTAYWVAENAAITESNLTFGQKTAVPHALAGLTKASNRMLRDSNPSVETLIREDLANILAVELDRALIKGSGASGQPLGLINTTGINTTTSTATMTLALAKAMIYEIEVDNAMKGGNLSWLLKYEQWQDMEIAAATSAEPKFGTGAANPISRTLWGYPVYLDGNLTDGQAIVGNFAQALLCQWGGLQFMASQHADTAFAADQTWIRAVMDVDLVVREPLSFCYNAAFA